MSQGSIIAAVLVIAWSQVESLLTYYVIWSGIGIVMAAIFYEPRL